MPKPILPTVSNITPNMAVNIRCTNAVTSVMKTFFCLYVNVSIFSVMFLVLDDKDSDNIFKMQQIYNKYI